MWSTTIFIATTSLLAFSCLFLQALFLRLGARLVKIEGVSNRRALAAMFLVGVSHLTLLGIASQTISRDDPRAKFYAILVLLLYVFLTIGILSLRLRTPHWKAFVAWIPTWFAAPIIGLFASFVIIPYVIEACIFVSSSMAPTLVGSHWEAACPRCGSPAVCSPEETFFEDDHQPQLMICTDHFHESLIDDYTEEVHPADRIIISKLFKPHRWDLLVYDYPEDPSQKFVHRLVGLPGEEVMIKNGAVWIDGRRLSPPPHLRGLNYVTEIEGYLAEMSGTEENPAQLAEDEYFVLGDFSARSRDSRMWQRGVPGHSSYAVPASHVIGIVTHIYWPAKRWRIFR